MAGTEAGSLGGVLLDDRLMVVDRVCVVQVRIHYFRSSFVICFGSFYCGMRLLSVTVVLTLRSLLLIGFLSTGLC